MDSNILVYAFDIRSPFHEQASFAVAGLAEGHVTWAIPWPCLSEFYSVATNAKLWASPPPAAEALRAIEGWTASPTMALLAEGNGFLDVWSELLRSSGVTGGQVHDARIAALCIYHGVSELWLADRDFGRFPRLKTRNPLVG